MSSYARFWTLLSSMQGDKEELKAQLVHEFSHGRTVHLREMTVQEYSTMIEAMARQTGQKTRTPYEVLKAARSAALHQMQIMGVNTSDWEAVDRFCEDARIAGVPFRSLTLIQLEDVAVKCRAIRVKSQRVVNYQLN